MVEVDRIDFGTVGKRACNLSESFVVVVHPPHHFDRARYVHESYVENLGVSVSGH